MVSEKKSIIDHEFYSMLSFTHSGIRVSSGERFVGRDKRFTDFDLNFLVSRGRIIDFSNKKNEVLEMRNNQKKKEEESINIKPLIENPFIPDTNTDTLFNANDIKNKEPKVTDTKEVTDNVNEDYNNNSLEDVYDDTEKKEETNNNTIDAIRDKIGKPFRRGRKSKSK
jgi:hypothetical protein